MTIYNEVDFVEYAIKSCLPYVDNLVIVEGAYQEVIKLGKSPRSEDGTIKIIEKYLDDTKVHFIQANGQTDKDQRNIGLEKIKELKSDWLLIIDGDEYASYNFQMVRNYCNLMERESKKVCYFQSLTFVNSCDFFCFQKFPRLFKIELGCKFVNDNYMKYEKLPLFGNHIIENMNIKYHHYSFLKGREKFEQKRNWWINRGFGKDFDYGWKMDENGIISDKKHRIFKYQGKHPKLIEELFVHGKV